MRPGLAALKDHRGKESRVTSILGQGDEIALLAPHENPVPKTSEQLKEVGIETVETIDGKLQVPEHTLAAMFATVDPDALTEPTADVTIAIAHPDLHVQVWLAEALHDAIDRFLIAKLGELDELHQSLHHHDHSEGSQK